MALLSEAELRRHLQGLGGWKQEGNTLRKEFKFRNFMAAIDFVRDVADIAENSNHHPDIIINYNKVTLILSTHSAGGITRLDVEFAEEVEESLKLR
jgi:4a-hydroxytetrahydrobiopterin dehydratase